jgi:hypothetical protein
VAVLGLASDGFGAEPLTNGFVSTRVRSVAVQQVSDFSVGAGLGSRRAPGRTAGAEIRCLPGALMLLNLNALPLSTQTLNRVAGEPR